MKDKQYLKEHKAEALKKIAEAIGKDDVQLFNMPFSATEVIFKGDYDLVQFNPLMNSEQWIECLMWYRHHVTHRDLEISVEDALSLLYATESREALLVAILELKGV